MPTQDEYEKVAIKHEQGVVLAEGQGYWDAVFHNTAARGAGKSWPTDEYFSQMSSNWHDYGFRPISLLISSLRERKENRLGNGGGSHRTAINVTRSAYLAVSSVRMSIGRVMAIVDP